MTQIVVVGSFVASSSPASIARRTVTGFTPTIAATSDTR
jgi:hypothetical protein